MVVSGQLVHTIILKQPTYSTNDESGRTATYANTITTKASVKELKQARTEDPVQIESQKVFTIRWRSAADAVTKDWKVRYEGEDYTIHSIKRVDEKDKFIEITANVRTDG